MATTFVSYSNMYFLATNKVVEYYQENPGRVFKYNIDITSVGVS